MRTRTKLVPATTNNITTGIINLLLRDGHSASRINIGGNLEPAAIGGNSPIAKAAAILRASGYVVGHWKKSGSRLGVADVLACMKPSGSFLAIEVKNELTNDRASKEQLQFEHEVRRAGGDYWIVLSYEEFVARYNNSKWSF